jgi:hypothetical protein
MDSKSGAKVIPIFSRADTDPLLDQLLDRLADKLADRLRSQSTDFAQVEQSAALMDVTEAMAFTHQSKTYVYRNWHEMGGRKFGKNLRFTRAGLEAWITAKGTR